MSDTTLELAQAITVLRAKQLAAVIPSTAAEIGAEIDALPEKMTRGA